MDVDGVAIVTVGTILWAVAFGVLLPFRGRLGPSNNIDWWLWTCLAGVGMARGDQLLPSPPQPAKLVTKGCPWSDASSNRRRSEYRLGQRIIAASECAPHP